MVQSLHRRRIRAVAFFSAAAALLLLVHGCGVFGEDRKILVVMVSGDMPHGLASDDLETSVVTLEDLGLAGLTDDFIEIYDKYDTMAEGVTDRDLLMGLVAQRQGELAAKVGMNLSSAQLLALSVPGAVYRESMSELDEAVFPDRKTYLQSVTRTR